MAGVEFLAIHGKTIEMYLDEKNLYNADQKW